MDKAGQVSYLEELGVLVYELCKAFKDHACVGEVPYQILTQLWAEQYELVSQQTSTEATQADDTTTEQPTVQSKKKGDLNGNVLQSPHDTDARYRRKDSGQKTQKVRGFPATLPKFLMKMLRV